MTPDDSAEDFILSVRFGLVTIFPMRVFARVISLLLLLSFAETRLCAASDAENRPFQNAVDSFNNGWWERAERQFAEFMEKYPKSDRRMEAILNQARARLKQNNFDGAAKLLSDNLAQAGNLAHEFQFWLGEAYFQNSNFAAAAEAYAKLTASFPDSQHFLESSYDEALSRSRLNDWPAVIALLNQPGAFQSAAKKNPADEFALRGNLLLAEAQKAGGKLLDAGRTLSELRTHKLKPELDFNSQLLLGRVQWADHHPLDALQSATNLLEIARTSGRPEFIAESVAFQADILEQLNRPDEAIAMLENFLRQNSSVPAADVAVLTVGELKLKGYIASSSTNAQTTNSAFVEARTNLLAQAQSQFDRLIGLFTNSQHIAKAHLDRGWCFWLTQKIPESLEDFKFAAVNLPFSKERAVARFKMGDCQFTLGDFIGALTNYSMVATGYTSLQFAQNEIIEPALYQIIRAAIKTGDDTAATNALKKILEAYPDSFITERAMLLAGQDLNRAGNSAAARNVFTNYLARNSNPVLLPEIQLAIARTHEHESNWTGAIEIYNVWIATFTNHASRARAEFERAWANDQARNETNALLLFTNFVAVFPTNDLAPLAQFWIGDYFFHHRDFQNAESSYRQVFQKWPSSPLRYEASMMAGRAAMALDRPDSAMENFARLVNSDCPPEFVTKALFAAGDAQAMTNNFANAITLFQKIPQLYKTNDLVPPALGRIGDCYLQLGALDASQYANATNYYQMVLDDRRASVTARSQAEFGIADALEKLAEKQPESERKALLRSALNHYQNVSQLDLQPGEKPDPVWVGKAQKRIAKLEEPGGK